MLYTFTGFIYVFYLCVVSGSYDNMSDVINLDLASNNDGHFNTAIG